MCEQLLTHAALDNVPRVILVACLATCFLFCLGDRSRSYLSNIGVIKKKCQTEY